MDDLQETICIPIYDLRQYHFNLTQLHQVKELKLPSAEYGEIKEDSQAKALVDLAFDASHLVEKHTYVIALSGSCAPIALFDLFKGGQKKVGVDTASLFKRMLLVNAKSYLCVHNHPFGDYRPTAEDMKAARTIWLCGELLHLPMADDLIVSTYGTYSLRTQHPDLFSYDGYADSVSVEVRKLVGEIYGDER